MPTSVLGLNGIDLLMAVIIALVVYIRRNDGIVAELFKVFGIVCTVFITLHYYARLADLLSSQFFGRDVPTKCFAFCFLFVLIFVAFTFISSGWSLILRIKSFEVVDRWGNLILSLVRGYIICSMLFLALILSNYDYVASKAKESMSKPLFSNAAVELYKISYSHLVEKFFPGEKINEEVFRLIGKESGKAKKKH